MVQKERKSGHWQVERLQFLKREQRGLRLRYAVIDLQPCDLQTAKFSCLLHHKAALIFQIKRPLFCMRRGELWWLLRRRDAVSTEVFSNVIVSNRAQHHLEVERITRSVSKSTSPDLEQICFYANNDSNFSFRRIFAREKFTDSFKQKNCFEEPTFWTKKR